MLDAAAVQFYPPQLPSRCVTTAAAGTEATFLAYDDLTVVPSTGKLQSYRLLDITIEQYEATIIRVRLYPGSAPLINYYQQLITPIPKHNLAVLHTLSNPILHK